MKKILSILLVLLVFLGGCSQAKQDQKELLKEAWLKQKEMTSFTMNGDVKVSATSLEIPVTLKLAYDTKTTKDYNDDELYMRLEVDALGRNFHADTWYTEGFIYVDNGTSKRYQDVGSAFSVISVLNNEELVERAFEYVEDAKASKNGEDTVITLTFKDDVSELIGKIAQINEAAKEVTELLKDVRLTKMEITVGKEGYIRKVVLPVSADLEGAAVSADVSLTISDIDTTVIPELNKAEYTGELNYDASEGYIGEDDYIDIFFDTGEEAVIMTEGDYSISYDESEGIFTVYRNKEAIAEGFFLDREFSSYIIEEVLNTEEDYKVFYSQELSGEGIGSSGKLIGAKALNDTGYFEADAVFVIVSFDQIDLGVAVLGYEGEEELSDLLQSIYFYGMAEQ